MAQKKHLNIIGLKKIVKIAIVFLFIIGPLVMFAQSPPHPNGGNAPNAGGANNTPVGGGAPIDGGFVVMMVLGAAYAIKKKVYIQK